MPPTEARPPSARRQHTRAPHINSLLRRGREAHQRRSTRRPAEAQGAGLEHLARVQLETLDEQETDALRCEFGPCTIERLQVASGTPGCNDSGPLAGNRSGEDSVIGDGLAFLEPGRKGERALIENMKD